jgi:MYXO-CTERM domain-containing protein
MFGCSADSACPDVAGATGECVTLGPATATDPVGICVYPAAQIDYCPATDGDGTVIGHYLATCHTTPTGEVTANYFLGDCDADGCPNGSDGTPCVAGEDVCGAVMRGGECGPGRALDGGIATPDASIDADGGNVQDDGGVGEPDAGGERPDGGTSTMDAGPPPVSFHGGGGCTCRVGSRDAPRSSAAAGALALGALVLGALRRRRR